MDPNDAREALRSQIHTKSAVLLLGAGTSKATCSDAKSWVELIRSGARRVSDSGQAPFGDWEEGIEKSLSRDQTYYITAAASDVARNLRAIGVFSSWIRDEFKNLKITRPDLLEAVSKLRLPILTTNYDTLIEDALTLRSVSPSNPALLQSIVTDRYPAVGHLHGVWTEPDTCVLDFGDYAAAAADHGSGTLLRALTVTRSFVYIGFGASLDDQNFSTVRKWAEDHLGATHHTHFLLCRDSDVASLETSLPPDVIPVGYGTSYDDLPGFLNSLIPTSDGTTPTIPLVVAREAAIASLLEHIEEDSLLLRFSESIERVRAPLVPPPLLPVPPEVFGRRDPATPLKRLDAERLAVDQQCVLLVGDELSGVTSALEWMLLTRSASALDEVPLLISARRLKVNRANALDYEARHQASAAGVIAYPRGNLPRLSLAVDDLHSCGIGALGRLVKNLNTMDVAHVWFGCRSGAENEVSEVFAKLGFGVQIVYMGSLRSKDIEDLATLAEYPDPRSLSQRAVSVIRSENLPRSPHSVSILLSVLSKGDAKAGALAEMGGLIQEYVTLLMSLRGETVMGADTVTPSDLDKVLQEFAKRLCFLHQGSVGIDEFFRLVEEYFKQVLIPVASKDVLDYLLQCRMLYVRFDRIGFQQDSYLYLYGARAALTDVEFANHLRDSLLYYAPVVKYYAGIARGDAELLARCLARLEEVDRLGLRGGAFMNEYAERSAMSMEEFRSAIGKSAEVSPREVRAPDEGEEYEFSTEMDSDPFPTKLDDEPQGFFRQTILLDLASTVLREGDQVRDPDLRLKMLCAVLRGHGDLIDMLEQDPAFHEFVDKITFESEDDLSAEQVELARRSFRDALPSFLAAGLLGSGLRTARLRQSLGRIMADESAMKEPKVMAMASLLALLLHADDYGKILLDLHQRLGKSRFVRVAVTQFAVVDYFYSKDVVLGSAHEEFLVEMQADGVDSQDRAQRNVVRGLMRQELRRRKSIPQLRGRLHSSEITVGDAPDGDS